MSTGGAAKPPPSGPPRATYCATASAMFGCSGVCSVGGEAAGCGSDDCFCFSGSVFSARTSSACVASGAGGRGAVTSWASRCGFGRCCVSCCGCGRGLGGGAWVTAPLPSAGDGVSEPDDRKLEGVPSNRGNSSGVTTSTTIASGNGAWKAFALTKSSPPIRTR